MDKIPTVQDTKHTERNSSIARQDDNLAITLGETSDLRWPLGLEEEPPLGAHLTTTRRGYIHHGIYAGHGRVVHYSGISGLWQIGPVEEVSLSRFAAGRPVRILDHQRLPYSPEDIVRRARSRLDENDYRLLSNNCEHFCNWCISGVNAVRWSGGLFSNARIPPCSACTFDYHARFCGSAPRWTRQHGSRLCRCRADIADAMTMIENCRKCRCGDLLLGAAQPFDALDSKPRRYTHQYDEDLTHSILDGEHQGIVRHADGGLSTICDRSSRGAAPRSSR